MVITREELVHECRNLRMVRQSKAEADVLDLTLGEDGEHERAEIRMRELKELLDDRGIEHRKDLRTVFLRESVRRIRLRKKAVRAAWIHIHGARAHACGIMGSVIREGQRHCGPSGLDGATEQLVVCGGGRR